ncbi:multiheme c-type cytochrome [Tundrisphaera sp. TA3]|uniref:multiheme c-type cytochrome n=1 Tax=Tundrisphaera sp. TA3 TaxID=3435775 RepID=UPI003EBB2141
MTHSSIRPVAAVGLVAAVLLYVGCTRRDASPDPAGSPTTTATESEAKPGGPTKQLADWWSPQPACIILISGEQDGYLQPCGCTDGQQGGLGRRYDLLDKLHAQHWPVASIDLGNLIHNPGSARGGFEQEKVKFGIALKALASMKYDAVALGPEDLKLGVMELLGQLLNTKEPRFLAANVKPAEGFEETIRDVSFAEAGPVKLGITAVLDPAAFAALPDPDKEGLLTLKPPDEVLPAVLDRLTKESQVRILLVQGPPEEAKRLGEKFPGFDIVVSTSKFVDPIDTKPTMLNDGKTMLIEVGKKGKYVGLVGVFPDSTPRFKYHRQALGNRYREAEPMRALIDEEYQSVLRSVGVVENFPRRPNVEAPTGASYVGAESCKTCHPNTFSKWAASKHAHAYEALLKNPKRNREFDAECISCHTTGFGFNTGWVSADATPLLKGNQCENCHGPASFHIAEPDNPAYRKPMARTAESADRNGLCIRCHDEDNDHNFTFGGRYPVIAHKGLDKYDDPKVHQGVAPAAAKTADAPAQPAR